MHKRQIIILILLFTGVVAGQPKWSGFIGGGFYRPNLIGLDSDSNSVIPSTGAFSENILLNWGVQYQFYPNARIGLSNLHSVHSGQVGSSDFLRIISYRMLTLETYFFIRKRMELNFTLAPMWNKATVSLSASSDSEDWTSLLDSYGNGSISIISEGDMYRRWFGFGSLLGFKFYIFTWLAVDTKMGFIQNFYNENKWKLGKEKVTGPTMNIGKLPVFNVNFVFGW